MKPYWQSDAGTIYQGHVLEVLKSMEAESVHCCVTSPPYWGLRDYGLEPQIWDGDVDCEHVWGSELTRAQTGGIGTGIVGSHQDDRTHYETSSQFCQLCGAWLGSLGLEPTPELYVKHIVDIFREVKRALRNDGTLWLNLGDSYAGGGRAGKDGQAYGGLEAKNRCNAQVKWGPPTGKIEGLKPKDLCGLPWRVAFALQADGWTLRSDIIWQKPNPMPESCRDRPTKAHEYLFLFSKNPKYYYDADAVREPQKDAHLVSENYGQLSENNKFSSKEGNRSVKYGTKWQPKKRQYNPAGRNKRSVWTIPTQPFPAAHFATFPEKLIEPCILAGCSATGIVLDPFIGSCTTGIVAYKHNRKFIGIDLSETYLKDIAIPRIEREAQQLKMFNYG